MNALLMELFDKPAERVDEFTEWLGSVHVPALDEVGVAGPTLLYEGTVVHTAQNGPRFMCATAVDPDLIDAWQQRLAEPPSGEFDALLQRRLYRPIDVVGETDGPTRFMMAVSATVPPDKVADYHAWYTDEHTPMLHSIDGWLRTRRYELVAGDAPQILALQDLATLDAMGSPVHRDAWGTPWRARVAAYRVAYERTMYRFDGPVSKTGQETARAGGAGAR